MLVRLRPLRSEDATALDAWNRDGEVRRHFLGHGETAREALLEPDCTARCLLRAIETLDGELLGWVELRNISWRGRHAEIRICLGRRDRWGMGYGTEALRAMLREAAARRLLHIYLRVATWNRRAIRSYSKCGFLPRGVLRAGRRREQGMDDLLLMGLDLDGRRR